MAYMHVEYILHTGAYGIKKLGVHAYGAKNLYVYNLKKV
jgi:hypothetical protein